MSTKDVTTAYEQAAEVYRKKYDAMPVRTHDVDVAFSYFHGTDNPRVLEIGCAYGREAQYILQKTDDYTGIDISSTYINMAQSENDSGNFIVADVLEYDFPQNIDIVFAFASFLHLSDVELKSVLERLCASLQKNAILFISLKRRDQYETDVVDDGYSVRRFYYYTKEKMHELIGDVYEEVIYEEQDLKEPWFTMVLRKK